MARYGSIPDAARRGEVSVNHMSFLRCFFVNGADRSTRDTGFMREKTWDFHVPLVCDTATMTAMAVVASSVITNESWSW